MPGIPGHFGDRESSLSLFPVIVNVQKTPMGNTSFGSLFLR